MWLHHLWNLFGRSWSAMVAAIGTTTLGFVLWTLLFTALGWFVGVVATWIKLRNRKIPHPFKEALRDSLLSGALSATTVLVILVGSYVIFFIRTVYLDHQSLVSQVATLNRSNAELTKELEIRNHSMVTNQPVF